MFRSGAICKDVLLVVRQIYLFACLVCDSGIDLQRFERFLEVLSSRRWPSARAGAVVSPCVCALLRAMVLAGVPYAYDIDSGLSRRVSICSGPGIGVQCADETVA